MQSKYIKEKNEIKKLPYVVLIDIMIFLLVIISFLYTAYWNQNEGYIFLCILPLTYGVSYFIVFRRRIYKEIRIFLTVFTGVCFVRYVCMPAIIVFSGFYGGRSAVVPTDQSFQKACLLMVYELIISVCLIEFLEHKRKPTVQKLMFHTDYEIPKYTIAYVAFFAVTVVLSLLVPHSYQLFSFIKPRMSGAEHLYSPPFAEAIVIYFMFTCKHLLFVLSVAYCYKKFKATSSKLYSNLAFIILLMNICIFYGLNRSDLVMPAIASLLLYTLLFGDKNIVKYIAVGGLIFFLITTIASSRELASISKNQSNIVDMADFIQGYFGGVYNVAISIETYEYFPEVRSVGRLLYDTFRPFIGFNVLLKNVDINFTNAYFNQRLWFRNVYSQIIPMVGQGYLHFGYLFSPILSCLTILFAYYLEERLNRSRRLEIIYFFAICLIRMAFLMGQNTGNISNELSMNLVAFGTVYMINNKVVLTEKRE